MPISLIRKFVRLEASGGIVLFIAAIVAIILTNIGFADTYNHILEWPFTVQVGPLYLHKSLLHWVNDGLMAIFFLMVGLELKREFLEGHLSEVSQVTLPAVAAVGGMVIPALIYYFFNHGHPSVAGWAIPAATDIAFALGVLMLLGKRAPTPLKLFLMALAIFDDLGAIIIIAVFHSNNLSVLSLISALVVIVLLVILNRCGVKKLTPYVLLGFVLWVCVLKSGVHATLAGVVLALLIPIQPDKNGVSPLHRMEHGLLPWVAFLILPLFAFVNAGVSFWGMSLSDLLNPVPIGIILGLFVGKQIGVFGASWLAVKLKLSKLPDECNWLHIYGVSILCGIGFTMSLFIGMLALGHVERFYLDEVRLGVIVGSFLSGIIGYLLLHKAGKRKV